MRKLANILACSALSLSISGCTIYDEKIAPMIGLAPIQTPVLDASPAAQEMPDKWWEFFADEDLNRLVENALLNNFDINMALLRKQAAEFELTKARSRYYPSVSLSPSAGLSYSKGNEARDSYSLPLSISYEADVWKKIAKAVEISELNIEITQEDIRAAQISLASDIVKNYFDIKTTEAQQEILVQKYKLQEELLTLVKSQKAYGYAERTAVIQLEQSLSQSQIQLIQNSETIKALQNSIAFLSAKPYGNIELFYLEGSKKAGRKPLPIPAEIPSRTIYNRPDVASSFLRLKQQQKQIYISKAELLPSFSISTSLSFASDVLGRIFDSDFFSLGASAGASYTVFDGGSERASVDIAETQYELNLIEHKKTLFNALKEVEAALIENESLIRQYEEKQSLYQQTLETLELVQSQKIIGSKTRVDEISQEIALLGSEMDLLSTANRITLARIGLLKALGGGFTVGKR